MKTGLFFGSFNPVHIGHMAIANFIIEFSELERIWFVVSSQNPLKKKKSLLADYHRLELLNLAIDDDLRFRVCDIELKLPRPSYTIDTLAHLKEKYPDNEFSIIMGSDGLGSFDKWKNYKEIIKTTHRYVYPRPKVDLTNNLFLENCTFVNAPQMDISSTFIRESLKNDHDIRHFLPLKVYQYMKEMHFYE